MTEPPLLIFADNYKFAWQYAKSASLKQHEWRYVTRPEEVFGYQGPGRYIVLRIPGYYLGWLRTVARREAIRYLRAHGFKEVNE